MPSGGIGIKHTLNKLQTSYHCSHNTRVSYKIFNITWDYGRRVRGRGTCTLKEGVYAKDEHDPSSMSLTVHEILKVNLVIFLNMGEWLGRRMKCYNIIK